MSKTLTEYEEAKKDAIAYLEGLLADPETKGFVREWAQKTLVGIEAGDVPSKEKLIPPYREPGCVIPANYCSSKTRLD